MKLYKNKLFKTLLIFFMAFFVGGIFLFIILNTSDKNYSLNFINECISYIETDNYSLVESLFLNSSKNLTLFTYIWISGFFGLSVIVCPLLLLYKTTLLGFIISNIIYTYKFKGLIISFFYFLFKFLTILLFYISSYYSLYESYKIYNVIKRKNSILLQNFFKNYIYIYIILGLFFIILSFVDTYFISLILKFIV